MPRYAQLAAFLCQAVLEARGALAVGNAFEDSFGDEAVEAVGEDVAGDAEGREQLIEAVVAEHDVPNEQQRPSVADQFQRPSDGAHLALVVALQHHREPSRTYLLHASHLCKVPCVTQVTLPTRRHSEQLALR